MSVVSVLVNKIDSERKYVLADPEIPFSIMSNFSGKKLEYVCNISGTSVEKIAEKLNLKPKTIEIDQKGIPKYLAGYMTLEESQLKEFIDSEKEKLIEQIRSCTDRVQEIKTICRGMDNKKLL